MKKLILIVMMFLLGISYITADNNQQNWEKYSEICENLYQRIDKDITNNTLYEEEYNRLQHYTEVLQTIRTIYTENTYKYDAVKYIISYLDYVLPSYSYDVLTETDEYQEYIKYKYIQYFNGNIKILKYKP
jgi:hypothetical protein